MTGPAPFVPTPFATASVVVSPEVTSAFRRTPYISPSEFINAPTAVATNTLLPGGSAAQNLQVLADTIMRASSWIDEYCFHTSDGTLAASPSTEAAWIKPKPDGTLVLVCKYRPILEVDALAFGAVQSQLQSLTSAPDLTVGLKTITLPPTALGAPAGSFPTFPVPTIYGGKLYVVWQYVNGYPHTYLAANCVQGATSITVGPALAGGSAVYGIYPGTTLTLHDTVNTETIVVGSVTGTTLTLQAGTSTAFAHTVPAAPDSIRVSALPWAVEQAAISMTSCLIKMRGTRAAILPMEPGGHLDHGALIEAGGLEDYEVAVDLLAPFVTTFTGHN